MKIIFLILLFSHYTMYTHGQGVMNNVNMNIYEELEKNLTRYLELVDQKRFDVEGFMLYRNTDSIPQEVFLIPFLLEQYDEHKTFEENFVGVISRLDTHASEEIFDTMRHRMPILSEVLKASMHIIVETDYPPVFNGGAMRVVYGRIAYRIRKEAPLYDSPTVSSITVKVKDENYKIIVSAAGIYGYPDFYRSLK